MNSTWIHTLWKPLYNKIILICIVCGIIPLIIYNKWDIVLIINKYCTNELLDVFFMYYTNTALGGIFVICTCICVFYSYRKASMIALSGIIILITSIVLKQIIFQGYPRPTAEIPHNLFFHIIDGFTYARHNSFPSGHTMSAFGLTAILSRFTSNKTYHILLLLYAISIAYSRIYMLQHFYIDVYAGAIFGFLCTYFIYDLQMFKKIPDQGIIKKSN